MSLLYSVVARKNIILARHASCIGNFAEITDVILAKLDLESNAKMTYQSGHYLYHYISEAGIVFLCITDGDVDRASAFGFLEAVKRKFESQYGGLGPGSKSNTAIPFAMNTEFSMIMSAEMRKINNSGAAAASNRGGTGDDKVERLRDEVQQVKDIMISNIDSIVERGERLELLVDKTEVLSNESVSFRQSSRALQRKMWWQNARMKVLLAVVVVLVIYSIVTASCGGFSWPKCVKK
ncbi:unnamed protein product [Sphagnum tenellum]